MLVQYPKHVGQPSILCRGLLRPVREPPHVATSKSPPLQRKRHVLRHRFASCSRLLRHYTSLRPPRLRYAFARAARAATAFLSVQSPAPRRRYPSNRLRRPRQVYISRALRSGNEPRVARAPPAQACVQSSIGSHGKLQRSPGAPCYAAFDTNPAVAPGPGLNPQIHRLLLGA